MVYQHRTCLEKLRAKKAKWFRRDRRPANPQDQRGSLRYAVAGVPEEFNLTRSSFSNASGDRQLTDMYALTAAARPDGLATLINYPFSAMDTGSYGETMGFLHLISTSRAGSVDELWQ